MVLDVYLLTKEFPKEEIYGITSQLRRAAASIPANISEGCGRNSAADFANFLNFSLGSVNEVSYFTLLSKDLGYLHEPQYIDLSNKIETIKAMLISLIEKVRLKKG